MPANGERRPRNVAAGATQCSVKLVEFPRFGMPRVRECVAPREVARLEERAPLWTTIHMKNGDMVQVGQGIAAVRLSLGRLDQGI